MDHTGSIKYWVVGIETASAKKTILFLPISISPNTTKQLPTTAEYYQLDYRLQAGPSTNSDTKRSGLRLGRKSPRCFRVAYHDEAPFA